MKYVVRGLIKLLHVKYSLCRLFCGPGVGPSHATVRTHVDTENVVVDHSRPRAVAMEGLVKFGCYFPDKRKTESRDSWKVVVFIVVSHVEGDQIEPSVI